MAKGAKITAKQSKANLRNLELRIKKLNEIDIPVAYENALIENEAAIIELLQEQLKMGISGYFEPITLYGFPEYSAKYIAFKRRYGYGSDGKQTDFVNLYLYGDFYRQMFTTIKKSTVYIKSNVPYYDKIIGRSGPEVMLLNSESEETLQTLFINPVIEQVIKEALSV
jgi:hypothetical protein